MAKRTGKSAEASPPTTRALEHGDEAAGAALKKPGFAFTPEDDLAFALGFPYLKYLVDDVQDPRAVAERLLLDGYPYQQVSYGREAAVKLVRALCLPRATVLRDDGTSELLPEATAALNEVGSLTESESRESILAVLGHEICPPTSATMTYLIIEALVGPDVVADALTEGLEKRPFAQWLSHGHVLQDSVLLLRLMALRLRPADCERVRFRLGTLRERILGEASEGFDVAAAERELAAELVVPMMNGQIDRPAALDLTRSRRIMEGRLDLVRSRGASCGFDALGCAPTIVAARPVVAAPPEAIKGARRAWADEAWQALPDSRLVFLGGEDVYRIELGVWSKDMHPIFPGEAHRLILERFGRIRSQLTVELVLDMSVRSRAKVQAKAWFAKRASYARPVLKILSQSSSRLAKDAAEMLVKLPS